MNKRTMYLLYVWVYVLHVGSWKATIKIGESRAEICSITARGEAFYIHHYTFVHIIMYTVVYYTYLLVIYKLHVSRSHCRQLQ